MVIFKNVKTNERVAFYDKGDIFDGDGDFPYLLELRDGSRMITASHCIIGLNISIPTYCYGSELRFLSYDKDDEARGGFNIVKAWKVCNSKYLNLKGRYGIGYLGIEHLFDRDVVEQMVVDNELIEVYNREKFDECLNSKDYVII